MNKIIIAMTESDAHVVANKLLQIYLENLGYNIINLGACSPLKEVIETAHLNSPEAIVLGSQNGHALEDIAELNNLKKKYDIRCPVIIGGNLSVGAKKSGELNDSLLQSGVDYICNEFSDLVALLVQIKDGEEVQEAQHA